MTGHTTPRVQLTPVQAVGVDPASVEGIPAVEMPIDEHALPVRRDEPVGRFQLLQKNC